jgi:aminoglycoside phosphotransferase family enzyme
VVSIPAARCPGGGFPTENEMRHITESIAAYHRNTAKRFVASRLLGYNIEIGSSVIDRKSAVKFYRKSAV